MPPVFWGWGAGTDKQRRQAMGQFELEPGQAPPDSVLPICHSYGSKLHSSHSVQQAHQSMPPWDGPEAAAAPPFYVTLPCTCSSPNKSAVCSQ